MPLEPIDYRQPDRVTWISVNQYRVIIGALILLIVFGLGRIVFAVAGTQLAEWLTDWRVPLPPVATLPITAVAPQLTVDGPAPAYRDEMMALYAAKFAP